MTKESFKVEIEEAINKLLELVEVSCTNTISENLVYIVSEIKNSESNFYHERRIRIRKNNAKIPMSLEEALDLLLDQFSNLHDVNLFIHKAERARTIIDIRYYTKSSLDSKYKKVIMKELPMIHCKISRPIYAKDNKFDVNWELGGIRHKLNFFCYRWNLKK